MTRDDKQKLLIVAGIAGVVYFGLLNPLLKFLGIKDDETDIALNQAATSPTSFWSPTFWRSQSGAIILKMEAAEQYARDIYNAFGPFNDCEECAIAVFKSLRYQTQCSFLAEVFARLYGQDLLTFLRGGGWPQDRLSDADVKIISDFISKLPVK